MSTIYSKQIFFFKLNFFLQFCSRLISYFPIKPFTKIQSIFTVASVKIAKAICTQSGLQTKISPRCRSNFWITLSKVLIFTRKQHPKSGKHLSVRLKRTDHLTSWWMDWTSLIWQMNETSMAHTNWHPTTNLNKNRTSLR